MFESLDIDLCNGTGPINKYFLSSEIQFLKVGRIPEISGKSPDPGQFFMRIIEKVFNFYGYLTKSGTILRVEADVVPRDIETECELALHIWSA